LTERRAFKAIKLNHAADRKVTADGELIVTKFPICGPAPVTTPPISFGATDADLAAARQIPADEAKGCERRRPGLFCFVLRDAVVHSRRGLVTAGGYFFTDSLYHVNLARVPGWTADCGPTPEGEFVLPLFEPTHRVSVALHALAGNVDNYFHWMIDVMGRLDLEAIAARCGGERPRVLIPDLDKPYKRQSLDLAGRGEIDPLLCGDETVVAVDRLYILPDISGSGFFFHPHILQAFARMRANAGVERRPPYRRIYVSRRDSSNRRLLNEDEVIDAVGGAGFEIVSLGEMSVTEQIALFGEAKHIVAPHGAGLTNILFASPGSTLLELHMDSYTQWSFRRLAGLVGLTYGCVIGTSLHPWDVVAHQQEWRIDVAALKAVLPAPPFARG
jgi:hypothetical protein